MCGVMLLITQVMLVLPVEVQKEYNVSLIFCFFACFFLSYLSIKILISKIYLSFFCLLFCLAVTFLS